MDPSDAASQAHSFAPSTTNLPAGATAAPGSASAGGGGAKGGAGHTNAAAIRQARFEAVAARWRGPLMACARNELVRLGKALGYTR